MAIVPAVVEPTQTTTGQSSQIDFRGVGFETVPPAPDVAGSLRSSFSSSHRGFAEAMPKIGAMRWRSALGLASVAAAAGGAFALGACAVGALAIGALAIGRFGVGTARFERLEIDELVVRKLTVIERMPSAIDS